jgi:hypothetical protein
MASMSAKTSTETVSKHKSPSRDHQKIIAIAA